MISPEFAQAMAAYNAEMNRRIYGATLRLSDADRKAERGLFWHSIHGTLSHILWADTLWLARLGTGEKPDLPIAQSDQMEGDFDTLWSRRQAFDGVIAQWAGGLAQADLEGELTWYSGAVDRELTRSRALCVMQIFNHQTHHRGQVHGALTALGEKTGDTDLPFVLEP
ncbi:DinB family protein [Pelagibacterium montanilacus]|uniref:DinB family protein n=1 Tax=Pelagibacterium montanilacus TaxID=2185280 RepID=UPI000F8C671F|nr:DinB family protein [Pelagibacterium montanilacus]